MGLPIKEAGMIRGIGTVVALVGVAFLIWIVQVDRAEIRKSLTRDQQIMGLLKYNFESDQNTMAELSRTNIWLSTVEKDLKTHLHPELMQQLILPPSG